ncbi:MAG: RNA-binding protein [Anaerolineales bacterium]|nr:RNA-binding protein [Anaerolineales bacterium]
MYVGNLSFNATEDQVRNLFEEYGAVESVAMITDRDTGRFRGFCFVEMASGADAAIEALDGQEVDGRNLRVNEARPREERGGGGGPRRGGGGYRGGGGGQRGGQRRDNFDRSNDFGGGNDRRW